MEIRILQRPITREELGHLTRGQFGDFVKAVVDVENGRVALGGELHADAEAVLLDSGSSQENLWGINLYPGKSHDEWIEFHSMINIRPSQGNRSWDVEDTAMREKIVSVIEKFIL